MTATLTITPDSNVKDGSMIDASAHSEITRDWDDIVMVYDAVNHMEDTVPVVEMSLYRHLLLIDGQKFRVLHMISK